MASEPRVNPRSPDTDAADPFSGHSSPQMTRSERSGPDAQAVSPAGLPKIVKFAALARCGDEIWIENEGQIYRLRKTRQGKLILTK